MNKLSRINKLQSLITNIGKSLEKKTIKDEKRTELSESLAKHKVELSLLLIETGQANAVTDEKGDICVEVPTGTISFKQTS